MQRRPDTDDTHVGYFGLALSVKFGKECGTVGFHIDQARTVELRQSRDRTLTCSGSRSPKQYT